MSEERFLIVPGDVLDAQRALATVTGKIQKALSIIEEEAARVLASWEGETREAFRQKQTRWNDDATAIQQRLVQLVAGVEHSVMTYVTADRQGVHTITG
jgi:WXG100 family type VII secretion target